MFEQAKRVSVAVRVRPVLRSGTSAAQQQEKFELEATSRIGDTQIKVEQKKVDEACRSSVFQFDYIFDQDSTQLEVYEEAVVELVDAALMGANATILAYGQTGSGKTHSVLGEVKPNPLENDLLTHNSGLFLRVLNDLMEYKKRRSKEMHVVVGLSCVEIYNENIRDLFGGSPGDAPPPLRAVMIGDDVYLPSLIVREVTSLQAVFHEIQLAIGRRQSRSTEMNSTSSRSHCLFMIDILQCAVTAPKPSLSLIESQHNPATGGANGEPKVGRTRGQTVVDATAGGDGAGGRAARNRAQSTVGGIAGAPSSSPAISPTTAASPAMDVGSAFLGTIYRIPGQAEPVWGSKILLADLAGSEKTKNSGVSGDGLAEATSINSSLTALGNVVHSLHEGTFVSYRTSNLTRLFKPTFSHPSSRVLLLAQVSPTQLTFDETINTLHFANKVKAMKVTTTTGAEAEKLQFDVIEAEKLYDSLLADLHIWGAETGCVPVIPRQRAKQGVLGALVYDAKARRAHKRDERRQILENQGYFDLAEAEKRAAVLRREKEEREFHEHIAKLLGKECNEQLATYRDRRQEVLDALRVAQAEVKDHRIKQLIVDDSGNRTCILEEESVAFLLLERQHYEGLKACGRAELASMSNELSTLQHQQTAAAASSNATGGSAVQLRLQQRNAAAPSRHVDPAAAASPTSAISPTTSNTTPTTTNGAPSPIASSASSENDDRTYALAAWGHCAAKRFFASIMELREAQWRLNLCKTHVASLSTWLAKAEAADKRQTKAQPS